MIIHRCIIYIIFMFTISTSIAFSAVVIETVPAEPVDNEPVYLHVADSGLDDSQFREEYSQVIHGDDGRVRIVAEGGGTFLPRPAGPAKFYLGRLPVGDYTVELVYGGVKLAEARFSVTSSREWRWGPDEEAVAPDHTGIWWNPAESGTSLVLFSSPRSRNLGGGFYLYDTEGKPVWYALVPGEFLNTMTKFRTALYRSTGSPLGQTYDPDAFNATQVGTIELDYVWDYEQRRDSLNVRYTLEGTSGETTLQRLVF